MNTMMLDGYQAKIEYDADIDSFRGEILGLKRGFDFAYALKAFFDEHKLICEDNRFDYGEQPYQLYGMIEKRHFVVVFTLRDGVYRIISARKANKREVKFYENHQN